MRFGKNILNNEYFADSEPQLTVEGLVTYRAGIQHCGRIDNLPGGRGGRRPREGEEVTDHKYGLLGVLSYVSVC